MFSSVKDDQLLNSLAESYFGSSFLSDGPVNTKRKCYITQHGPRMNPHFSLLTAGGGNRGFTQCYKINDILE